MIQLTEYAPVTKASQIAFRSALVVASVLALGAQQRDSEELRGKVVKLDPARKELMVEGRKLGSRERLWTFRIEEGAPILIDNKPGKIEDLPLGKRVRVLFETRNGERVAKLVVYTDILGAVLRNLPAEATQGGLLGELLKPRGPEQRMLAPPMPQAAKGQQAAGVLRRLARTEREIVVVGAAETTLLVPDDTRIVRDGKAIAFEDLREGESVTVDWEKAGKQILATTIQAGVVAQIPQPQGVPQQPQPGKPDRLGRVLEIVDLVRKLIEDQ